MPRKPYTRRAVLSAAGGGIAAASLAPVAKAAVASADRFDLEFVDAEVERFRAAFDVPGFAVAIVSATPQPFLKGYGFRTLGRPERVDAHTRFGIASNTKAYTAALMAILVDEGRVAWHDPIVRHLPEFRMYDPAVTQMMTLRDLLCHRSGLPLARATSCSSPNHARGGGRVESAALPEA